MITFVPFKSFDELLDQSRRDVAEWWTARGDGKEPRWAEWAGDNLARMMREREAALQSLQSPNTSVRLAAISLVAEYWLPSGQLAADALRLAFEDSEPAVRGAALAALYWLKPYVSDRTGVLNRLLRELFPGEPEEVAAAKKRQFREKMAHARELRKKSWHDDAGAHATRILQSRDSAESCLNHPDPRVRIAALHALREHWKPDEKFPRLCESLVREDGDTEVRCRALVCLARYYATTDDLRIGRLAARLVCDDSKAKELRESAYRALFTIRGMPIELSLKTLSPTFRFPEDVDWEFVDSFIGEEEGGEEQGRT